MEKRLIREPECRAITGLSRVTRWRLERAGKFPKRVEILPGVIAWEATEIQGWVDAKIAARDESEGASNAPAAA